jgi:hypothetical protein
MSHSVHEPNNHVHKDGNKGGEQKVVQDFLLQLIVNIIAEKTKKSIGNL